MEDFLKCPLCSDQFNLDEHKPLINKCGHSYCKHCLLSIKENKKAICPLCIYPSSISIKLCVPNSKLEQIIKLYHFQERKKPMIYVKPEEARGKSPGVMIKKRITDNYSKFKKENNIKRIQNEDNAKRAHHLKLFDCKKDTCKTDPNSNIVNIIINDNGKTMAQDNNEFDENIEFIPLEQDQSVSNVSFSLREDYPELFNNKHAQADHNNNIQIKNRSISNSNTNPNRNNSKSNFPIENNQCHSAPLTKEEVADKLKKELFILIPSIQKRKIKETQLVQAIDKECFKDKYASLNIKVLQPSEDLLISCNILNALNTSFGVVYSLNGDYYEGDIFNDRKEGFGKYEYKCGSKYEGLLKANQPNGYGKLIQQDGEIFIGQWKDGKINGNGIRYHNNGDRYIGTYFNNIRNGNGHYFFSNGDSYDGNWFNGKTNGQGKFFFKNGNYYEGEFCDNLITGKGVFKILNGNTFIGTFKNGLINGNGTMEMINGDIYKGDFVNGKRQGNGIVYDGVRGQIKLQGKWFNDKYINIISNHFE